MGLFEKIFKFVRQPKSIGQYFKTLNGYEAVYSTYRGGAYEMLQTRAAIHTIAQHCSKLKLETVGSAQQSLGRTLAMHPNPWQTTSQFIYRLSTILLVNNSAFIIPIYDSKKISGIYPILPQNVELREYEGELYLRYHFSNGQYAAIEFYKVGLMVRHQYRDDFFGEDNSALNDTMQLIHAQSKGIQAAIKNGANIRFLARVQNILDPEDIRAERDRFSEENLSEDNKSGVIIFDHKFDDVRPIESKGYVVNPNQMKLIDDNVNKYFGVNDDILKNSFNEATWNAFYEGVIEPFALQLSEVITRMIFSPREIAAGNAVMLSSNRLQYASSETKLQVSTQLFDRGILSTNQVMDIWNLPHVPGGDRRYIRKEYEQQTAEEGRKTKKEGDTDAGSADTGIQNDHPAGDPETGDQEEDRQ